jgi:hypothetical protein
MVMLSNVFYLLVTWYITSLGKMRQENLKVEASLSYIA